MLSFTDQLGRIITICGNPQRIVSLVPSQTELLFDLGLEKEVVGITKFCVHPAEWLLNKTIIGGTKTVKLEVIHKLQPDLIVANREENVKDQIEELARQYPVWVSDVNTLANAMRMISEIGRITFTNEKASKIITEIEQGFTGLNSEIKRLPDPTNEKLNAGKEENPKTISALPTLNSRHPAEYSTCYLIWKDPFMTTGGDTFINDMLQYCGLTNAFSHLSRYPVISIDQLQTTNLQYLLLSSEPYPFSAKHMDKLQQQLPDTKIILVDGEMFSWYGSRLIKAPTYFKELMGRI